VAIPLYTADRFKLIVQSDGLVSRPHHIASRKERRIGIAVD
jgi:hypothetical protein